MHKFSKKKTMIIHCQLNKNEPASPLPAYEVLFLIFTVTDIAVPPVFISIIVPLYCRFVKHFLLFVALFCILSEYYANKCILCIHKSGNKPQFVTAQISYLPSTIFFVSIAIISSSFVGITRVFTLAPSAEISTVPLVLFLSLSYVIPR